MKRWRKLYSLDGTFICPYCLKTLPIEQATKDHKIPRNRGGKTEPDNIVACCFACNSEKGALTPEEYELWKLLNEIRVHGIQK